MYELGIYSRIVLKGHIFCQEPKNCYSHRAANNLPVPVSAVDCPYKALPRPPPEVQFDQWEALKS